jgi:hypothetical protein
LGAGHLMVNFSKIGTGRKIFNFLNFFYKNNLIFKIYHQVSALDFKGNHQGRGKIFRCEIFNVFYTHAQGGLKRFKKMVKGKS